VEREICVRESCSVYQRFFHTPSENAKRLYYYPQWAGRFVCEKDFYIFRHSFCSLLLIKTASGVGKLLYRGNEYCLDQNHVALIDCREKHIYYPISREPWDFQFLHFAGVQSMELYAHIYELTGTCIFPLDSGIIGEMDACIRLCAEGRDTQEAALSCHISNIIYGLLIRVQQAQEDGIEAVCQHISKHFAEPLTTLQLSQIASFSRCYFSTAFKKRTGATLHEYLICRRLDRAKELLSQGELPVNQIAEAVGFTDVGTLIRAFKRKEKMTPLQYRKKHFSIRAE